MRTSKGILFGLLLLLLTAPGAAQSLLETTDRILTSSRDLLARAPEGDPTWAESQALDNFKKFIVATEAVQAALSSSNPTSIEPQLRALRSTRRRLSTDIMVVELSVVAANQLEEILDDVDALDTRIVELRNRFNGLAQPQGEVFASTSLKIEPLPQYSTLRELSREARNVKDLASRLRVQRARGGWMASTGTVSAEDLRRFNQAAGRYLDSTISPTSVYDTQASYQKMVRAFNRVDLLMTRSSQGRQLERAMGRLKRFYSAL
jgi:flagellar biosynthesis chaperone FliJ